MVIIIPFFNAWVHCDSVVCEYCFLWRELFFLGGDVLFRVFIIWECGGGLGKFGVGITHKWTLDLGRVF